MQLQLQPALLVSLPPAVVVVLVLPTGWVAGAGPGLDVVPPHVLGALAVGPQVLAGDRTGVAPDALVEVEQHAHLGSTFMTRLLVARACRSADVDEGVSVDPGGPPVVEGIGELGVAPAHQHRLEPGPGERVVHPARLLRRGEIGMPTVRSVA